MAIIRVTDLDRGEYEALINTEHIVDCRKPLDSQSGVTIVTMVNGDVLRVNESIKTLAARCEKAAAEEQGRGWP